MSNFGDKTLVVGGYVTALSFMLFVVTLMVRLAVAVWSL